MLIDTKQDTAAFKANPINTIIGVTKKRVRAYFASSCHVSSSNETKASGYVEINGWKSFTLKLQQTIPQLLDPKISSFEAPKDVAEEWSQNHVLEMVLAM